MVIRSLDELDAEPDSAPRRWREGLPPGPECRRAMADCARSHTDDPTERAEIDLWFGVEREPSPPGDGTRGAIATVTAVVGLSVPFASALADPVAAAGLGALVVGGVVAVLAMDRDRAGRGRESS